MNRVVGTIAPLASRPGLTAGGESNAQNYPV